MRDEKEQGLGPLGVPACPPTRTLPDAGRSRLSVCSAFPAGAALCSLPEPSEQQPSGPASPSRPGGIRLRETHTLEGDFPLELRQSREGSGKPPESLR